MNEPKKGRKNANARPESVDLHDPLVMKRIAETAYYLWEKRGCPQDSDWEDWMEAENIVLGKK